MPISDSASPDWEARAAALRASPLRDSSAGGSPPQQQPSRMEPPPPPPQEPLKICGDKLKVHFYGVADKDWNLGPSGIGIKHGTTGLSVSVAFGGVNHPR